jgi:hypothetical protein
MRIEESRVIRILVQKLEDFEINQVASTYSSRLESHQVFYFEQLGLK